MNNSTSTKVDMTQIDLAQIANGIARLSEGLSKQVFDSLDNCYADEPSELPGRSKADEWILEHYETAAGAIDLIAASSDILSRVLMDSDISFS